MSRLMIAVALFGACTLIGAQKVYKWTDENGQVHFDASPPPGTKTEELRIRSEASTPPPADPAAAAATTASSEDGTPKPEMTPEAKEKLTKYCTELRANIALLRSQGGRIVEENPDGTRNPLGAPQIAERLQGSLNNEQQYCTSNAI